MPEKADDMLGKIVVVTGASGGIGREIARGLALKRATVIVAARDLERGRAAALDISNDAANPAVELLQVDVSSGRSIAAFAEAFGARHRKLDVLVNNAGVWLGERRENDEGVEMTWATNVLGYFRVTRALEPALRAAAPSRVVNVASQYARGLDLDDVEFKRRRYSGDLAYAQSKQADRMLSWAFADRLKSARITVNALHPGMVATGLASHTAGLKGAIMRAAFKVGGISPERGADTAVWLASSRALADDTSGYYIKKKETRCPFRDEAQIAKLWALCESTESTRGTIRFANR